MSIDVDLIFVDALCVRLAMPVEVRGVRFVIVGVEATEEMVESPVWVVAESTACGTV